jgi:tetratricopeptide (TPR) repeat protein
VSDTPETSGRNPDAATEPARQFWRLWQDGPPPDLRQFLSQADPLPPLRLAAVLCVDLRERWRRRERVPAEDYLRAFPRLAADREAALDLVYCEFLARDALGESPPAAEYAARFPDLQPELGRQIDVHRALGSADAVLATVPDARGGAAPGAAAGPAAWPTFTGCEVLGELGHGGMGVVYKAWQTRLRRAVAVKMLLPGACDAAQALARFRVEAEAAARLQHPNIVQIHEVGEHDGRPYLVMEFAGGGSLAHRLDGTPWAGRDAARLVETLARAVQAAHEHGVLHRDLKPGNVLLLADGTPKLSDFGLAKLLVGGATLTQTGGVFGTPSYMPPEQASGNPREMGPAVDVYALGAVLYQLLTGRPPFKAATALETLHQVKTAEPVAPRALQPAVPRDLETVCLKCLQKDPRRRYASAGELAEDLRRFAAGEPIRARPVGRPELLVRWCRRNPAVAALLTLLAVVVTGGVVTVVGLWLRAERMRDRADANYREAQDNFRLAFEAVEQYCTRVGQDKRLQEKDLRPLRQQLLQTAVDFHEKFVERRGDDPGLRAELARAYLRLGGLTAEIDARPRAIDFYERAAALFEGLSQSAPDNAEYRRGLASARLHLGSLYDETGRPADGEAALLEAVRLGERLVADDADSAADQAALAGALARLSFFYQRNGRAQESLDPATRSIELSDGLVQRFPKVVSYRVALVRSRGALGDLYRLHSGPRRWRDAEKEYLTCLEHQKEVVALEPKDPEYRAGLANLHRVLGNIYRILRRPQQAEQSYKDGITIMEELVRRHGSVASYRMTLAELYDSQGEVYRVTNRIAEAEAPWQEALRLRRQLVEEDPTDADYLCALAISQCHVGLVQQARGRHAEAVGHFSQSVETLEKVRDPNPQSSRATRNLAIALEERARSLGPLGRHAEALRDWDRVLELTTDSLLRPMYRMERTLALARTGDHARATADAEGLLGEFAADAHFAASAYKTTAAVHAVAARAAGADAALPEAERAARAERHAARAVALLQEAIRAGHDLSVVKGDADFDFLRTRDDFKKLLAEMPKGDGK